MINDYKEQNFKLETIDPCEAIVLYYNFEKIDLYELQKMCGEIEHKFPNNTVVCVPDRISLEAWSKDELENYMSLISEVIDNL